MANTSFLQLPLLTTTQAGKEITINQALTTIDDKVKGALVAHHFYAGAAADGKLAFAYVAAGAISLAATGHAARAVSSGPNGAVLVINKNGAQVGTIVFGANGTTGNVSLSSGAVSLSTGDLLTIAFGNNTDPAVANIAFALQFA